MKIIPTSFSRGILAIILLMSVSLSFSVGALQIFAHGGEDHDDSPKQTVSTDTNIVTQVVHTGEFEITLKHAPLKPDTKNSAQVFVTNYKTNTPIGNAKLDIIIEREGSQNIQVTAKQTETAGILSLEFPPIEQGTVKLNVQVNAAGKIEEASFGSIAVEHQEINEAPATQDNWTRTVFFGVAAIFILSIVATASWFAVKRYRATKNDQPTEIESDVVSV